MELKNTILCIPKEANYTSNEDMTIRKLGESPICCAVGN
ncbi:hypothetical protein FHS14_006200 [Paenibacillus baekrokdamisoli]|nr:hypothetical protein [Paenibacillus baekrokdamisoli]